MQRLSIWLTDYVIRKDVVKEEERAIYEYGFQAALETILSLFLSILIAIPLNMVVEGILFFVVFIPLRSYAGGFHLEHYISCLLLSCITYSGVLFLVKLVNVPAYLSIVLIGVFVLSIWLLYPVEHINRSVDGEEDMHFKKRLKQWLVIDVLLAIAFFLFKCDTYLFLMTATFFLSSSTMLIGKVKNKRNISLISK